MSSTPSRYHQVYLRTTRGGWTVPRALGWLELEAVFGSALTWLDEEGERSWRRARFHCDDEVLAERGARLGYTVAIVSVDVHPAAGRAPTASKTRAAFPVGWRREGERELYFLPVYRERSPDGHEAGARALPDRRRRLSRFDARLCANLCGVEDGAGVLDPFAGAGGLAEAARARGLHVVIGDVDAEASRWCRRWLSRAVTADARSLPFADASFSGVLTEPPYRREEREAVRLALPELFRVVARGGVVALLVTEPLAAELREHALREGALIEREVRVTRHGLECLFVVARVRSV